jgi:small subunit ribosomal protein S6
MRPYEIMVILDVNLEEEQIRAVLDRSTETIKAGGGSVGKVDRWGKRRFAYELAKRWEGYYILLEATAPVAAMNEVDRQLRLSDGVLRHKVIRIPDHVATAERRPLTPPDEADADTAAAEA